MKNNHFHQRDQNHANFYPETDTKGRNQKAKKLKTISPDSLACTGWDTCLSLASPIAFLFCTKKSSREVRRSLDEMTEQALCKLCKLLPDGDAHIDCLAEGRETGVVPDLRRQRSLGQVHTG